MLESLLIRNIALFEQASIQFDAGLIVLTGETGAGKSLVVDAMNLLCGAKADKDLIRNGSDSAYVEGIFTVDGSGDLLEYLISQGIDPEDNRLILSRELNLKGRSLCRVNGMAFSLSAYQQITARLIDLHGQHEHQSLLHDGKHLNYLDLLGEDSHISLLQKVGEAFMLYQQSKKAYDDALKQSQNATERLEVLRIRQKELKDAKLVSGEDEALLTEKNMLRNAGKIANALGDAEEALLNSQQSESALSLLRQALAALEKITQYHPNYLELHTNLQSQYYELEEAAHELSVYQRELHHDDIRLEQVESRLDYLRKLQRKYGTNSEAMLQVLDEVESEIKSFESLDEDLDKFYKQAQKHHQNYLDIAKHLSDSRVILAQKASQDIEAILNSLNMSGTKFSIRVIQDEKFASISGMDQVSMYIAPNAGEEPKPLSRIASGGELSRVMLAMKALSAEKNVIPTMVFDEIDTGVSGKTASVLAQKLCDIGRFRQVVCVTHLHQLAAMANQHFFVSKHESEGRTKASVATLKPEEREREIAKMLGDLETQGQSSLQHAKVLLSDAADYRKKHSAS